MKVTLTKISFTERVSPKTGRPYTSCSIKTQEHGDKYISGFRDDISALWREGDAVDIDISEKTKDGKTYLNFKPVKVLDRTADGQQTIILLEQLNGLASEVKVLKAQVVALQQSVDTLSTSKLPVVDADTGEIDPDDMPY